MADHTGNPSLFPATTATESGELKQDGASQDFAAANARGRIDERGNLNLDHKAAGRQSLSKSPSPSIQAQGRAKSRTPPTIASRNPSPPADSLPVDEDAVHQATTTILASSANSDDFADDGYNTDQGSASTSIESSVRDYLMFHGRRYHRFREGAYIYPNDEPEQEREDMKHAMVVKLCGGKLHFAPLEELDERGGLQRIIDLGTGTGIWAIEMGDKYPSAQILGIDLSPIQPNWVPPNVTFMVDDAESPWLQSPDYFDYVHSRHMAVTYKDWPRLLRQSYTHLKPGGFLEIMDFILLPHCHDGTMRDDWPLLKFYQLCSEGLQRVGIDPFYPSKVASNLSAAGFTNVHVQIFSVPIGRWPRNKTLKEIGVYWQTCIFDFLQAAALGLLMKVLGWSREAVEVFLVDVRKSMSEEGVHATMPLYCVYAQKPLSGEW